MEITLPEDLKRQLQEELAAGRYKSAGELIEDAVRQLFDTLEIR